MKQLTTLILLIMIIASCSNNEKKQETVIIKTDTKELEEAQNWAISHATVRQQDHKGAGACMD